MDAATLSQSMTAQYGYTSYVFEVNLKGLSDDEAFGQPEIGGNCLNWVAGHITWDRAGALCGGLCGP